MRIAPPTTVLALLAILAQSNCATRVVLTNDDGWAVANIRAFFAALADAGFDVLMSAPADNRSGTGSSDTPPQQVGASGCEFSSCPPNSPAEGSDPNMPRFNYVNSFPVTAVRIGIQTLAPQSQFFGSDPIDIVLSGPNVGTNLGGDTAGPTGSGTVGAATEAAKEGLPSVAFSGRSGGQVPFTTLSTPSDNTTAAEVYAALGVTFTNALLASSARPILPTNVSLNVNYPATTAPCTTSADFRFVLTRVVTATSSTPPDVETCGSNRLPTEASIVNQSPNNCLVSVSVMNANTKADVGAETQATVLRRLENFLTCP